MSLLTVEEFLIQSIQQKEDPEVIEILEDVGISVVDVRQFLEIDEKTENREQYGTFWKRFMQHLMGKKIAEIPLVYAIMNPMRLILQNLKDPITVVDLKYENQFSSETQVLDLTQVCFIDQKILSHYLSLNANTPNTNTLVQLMNSFEISIQQISSFRGVDVAMASILYDEVHDEHLDQSIAWVSCDHSPSVIFDVNIDLLLLLTRELKYTYDIWKKVMSGKTPNIERQNIQVSKNLRDFVNDEGLLFVNLRGIGIAKVITSPHQEPIQLSYVFGSLSFLDIDSKYINNYDQYLKTHERRQSELLQQQQQQAQQSLQHTSELDDGSRRKKLKPFLTPPAVPKDSTASSTPPAAPVSTQGSSKTKAIAEQFSSPTTTKKKEFVSPSGVPSSKSHDSEGANDSERNLSHPDDTNSSHQPTKRNPAFSPGIMNENLLDTPDRPHSTFGTPVASNPPVSSSPARSGVGVNLDFEERDDMTLKERKELRKRREEYEKQRKLQEFLRVEGNTKDFLPTVSQDPRDPSSTTSSVTPAEQSKVAGTGGTNAQRKGSVKDRFVIAQLAQQEQENERLAKFKNDPNKRINTSGVSEVRSKWSETVNPDGSVSLYSASQDPNHSQVTDDDRRGQQKTKLRNKWEEALHETKNTEISRFQNRKLHTISQFRVTQGTGIVKKRIGEWEELFMQIAATAEQLEEFLRAAHALSEKNEFDGMTYDQILELQQQFLESCQVAEDFVINDTHIYSSKMLSPIIHSYLKKALADSKTNHFSLSCGVYGESASKPPIDVFAAAIKTNQGKIYVALTVKAALGKDLDMNVYGLKKVTVLGKDLQTNIFEKILNILPMPGWEAWIADGHYEEMRAIISYNKLSASRNTSFYDSNTARADGASNALDDFDMIEEEDEESGSLVEVEESVKTENTVLDNNLSRRTEASTIATGNKGEEEELEDVDLSSSKKTDDNDEMPNYAPPAPPIESMPSIDATEVVDRSTSGGMVMPSHKRLSTGSTVSEFVPGDEGEGTWALTLTPTPDSPPRQNDGDLHNVVASLEAELNTDPQARPEKKDDLRSSSVGAENEYDDEHDSSRQDRSSHLRSDESQGFEVARAGGKTGEFSDDEDDDDETQGDENEEEADDDNEEHYHFGKSPVLVSATVARSYLPSSTITTNFMRSKHNQSKFSWTIESELEKRLDSASHDFTYLNLRDVKNSYCVSNFFIIQGGRNSAVFTGNLAHAMTDSVYILEGERVFEWIRGAAASGWCWKFPMQSQNFGRLRKRFFILRDNVLSYHKIKPKHEDDIASAFSHNTLHLTDTSTVSIGRRRLQRCLIVATPLDTLWLKMSKDFTSEAVKWTNEITKAIQGFSRPKLIMTKARIESKWYHESPLFSLVNVDVVTGNMGSFGMNLSEEEHSSYCKVALFCLRINIHHTRQTKFSLSSNSLVADPDVEQDVCTYSVDIATNDTQRLQVEILNEDETINLSNRLSIVKVYGDYLLFGGNKGYLSLGVLSKTKPSTMLLAPSQGKGGAANNVSTSKRVMFTIPLIDKLLETSVQYQNEKRKSSAEPAFDPATSSADIGGGAGSAMMMNYPHSTTADITAIAVACYNSIFAAADSSGVISLWYLPRNPKLGNLSVRSSISNPSGMKKLHKRLKLYVITVLNIKNCDSPFAQQTDTNKSLSKKKMQALLSGGSDGEIVERVVKMKFLYQDSYLLVCTNRRMLLFSVQYQQSAMGFSAMSPMMMSQPSTVVTSGFPQQSFEECYSRGTSMDFTSLQNNSALKSAFSSSSSHARPVRNVVGFSGWVELDRAVPRCYGIFDFFISEEFYDVLPNSGAASPTKQSGPSRKIVQWRAAEIDDEDEGKNYDKGSKLAAKLKSLVPPSSSSSSSSSEALLRKCTVSRLQWTEAMFEAALAKLKPCPAYSPFD